MTQEYVDEITVAAQEALAAKAAKQANMANARKAKMANVAKRKAAMAKAMVSEPTTTQREIPLRDEPHATHESRDTERQSTAPIHETYDDSWTPPMLTNAPPALPGMVQRWIRIKIDGADDPGNVARRMQEGWTPRPASTVPKGFFTPVIQYGQYGNVIGNSDSILMQRSVQLHAAYARHVASLSERQTKSVRENVRGHMPGEHGVTSGQVQEFNVKTTKGTRPPKVADDED